MTAISPSFSAADSELVARIRGGEAAAFAEIMRVNNRRLYRLARGILKDESEAEEAVQEGYVRAFTNLGGFKGEASLATWLARIVTNEALGRLRRRRPSVDIDAVADSSESAANSPEHRAARREIRRAIEGAVDTLPVPFRAVFMLRAIEGLSIRETAQWLGIPEETVKTRFHRANRLLRQALSAEFAAVWDDAFPFGGSRCDRLVAGVLDRLAILTLPSAPLEARG